MKKRRIVIMGAAGRDFHNFNVCYRDNEQYEVVAFTAAQIPDIANRKYPKELAGMLYPEGIPIYQEDELTRIIKEHNIDEVVFSYSDVSYQYVMKKSAIVNSAGADFMLLGPRHSMLTSKKPVIAVCATRTGSGKSQFSRTIFRILNKKHAVATIRHPMPYGDLVRQRCQRFATYEDLERHQCTIEEREEYEPYLDMGGVIYAGVDYGDILHRAEKEADVIVWDGGNNDFPFYTPTIHITVVDPHRAGDEVTYYPGEANLRMADIIIINKVDTADRKDIEKVEKNIREVNPSARIIKAQSPIQVENGNLKGKKALVIEDGPTLTHGGMKYGAGAIAAKESGVDIINPRAYAVGSIKKIYEKYPHLSNVLPAMGYSSVQVKELEQTINKAICDVILSATPIDLRRVVNVNKPIVRVRYGVGEDTTKTLENALKELENTYLA